MAKLLVGDRLAAQLAKIVAQLSHLVDIEISADVVPIVLRHVEIMRVDMREHHLPHAGQIADHVADRREQHAVDEIDAAGYAELDGRARNAADIALVIGVAVDHLELVAAAHDAERQHIGGVDEFARHVDRHVADYLAAGLGGLPLARRREGQILKQRSGAGDDVGRSRSVQRCCHWGDLFAIKASSPATASWVAMSSSR